jgi:hypothetical protein
MIRAAAARVLAALLGAPAFGQVRPAPPPAPVPIVLPAPPPSTNLTGSALWSARLAIARAQLIDPQAAQTAAFQYVQAVQQFRSGDATAAHISALAALATAGGAQVLSIGAAAQAVQPLVSAPAQLPGLAGGLYGADAAAIDADSFLALGRGTIDDCKARHDRRLAAAQAHLARAEQDFAARNWSATRSDAKAAIDACAVAAK